MEASGEERMRPAVWEAWAPQEVLRELRAPEPAAREASGPKRRAQQRVAAVPRVPEPEPPMRQRGRVVWERPEGPEQPAGLPAHSRAVWAARKEPLGLLQVLLVRVPPVSGRREAPGRWRGCRLREQAGVGAEEEGCPWRTSEHPKVRRRPDAREERAWWAGLLRRWGAAWEED